ncbi:MAG: hypothetical protein ACTSVB_01855 [Candidatus Heimdallarchaeaceae archaeon]
MSYNIEKQYTRVIKYGMSLGVKRVFETIVFAISIFSMTFIYLYVLFTENVSAIGKYMFFPIGIFLEIVLILAYIENHYSIEIFGEIVTKFFTTLSILSLLMIIIYSSIPALYTNKKLDGINISLLVIYFILVAVETGYFLYSVPRGELSESFGMEKQFSILEKKLKTINLNSLPIEKAINKGIETLKKKVSENGVWGSLNPLYETAIVLEFFHSQNYEIDSTWTIKTSQGKRPVSLKNSFDYISTIVDMLEETEISYEQLYILYVVSLFDPSTLDPHLNLIETFKNELKEETEWDFINSLNQFSPNVRSRSTPPHFIFAYIADVIGEIELLDRISLLFTKSIDIIIKRGYSRFSTSKTGRTPMEMFARLMLTLYHIRRMPPKRQEFLKAVQQTQFIEGSWEDDIGTTGYVIQSLIPSETIESMPLKKGTLYLLAMQDKEGMWNGSIEETITALKTLIQIKKFIGEQV